MSSSMTRILVVDDDPLVRLLARETLEREGFAVTEAEHGAEALARFASTGGDLILLDVIMPRLDGFATCERLRQSASGAQVPILMMTGLDDQASIQRAYDAGATDFIVKPIVWAVLVHRVRYILRASAALQELAWRADFQRVLIETMPVPILVEDAQGRCLAHNQAFDALAGESVSTAAPWAHRLPAAGEPLPAPLTDAQTPCGPSSYETELIGASGERRAAIVHQVAFTPPGTGEAGRICAFLDITERKRHEERLRMANTVFQSAPEAIMVTDANGVIQSVNPAFTAITGYHLAEAIGNTPRLLKSGRYDQPFYAELWRHLTELGKWSGEIWQRRKNGDAYPVLQNIEAVRDPQGCIVQYVAFFTDISERKLVEQEIFFRANYDPLTGLPNRSLLHEQLDQVLKRACRRGKRVALLFLDLDHFKQVNDTLGHALGDALLYKVAQRIKASVRETDTVARHSGDEFVLVLPDIPPDQDASTIAGKVLQRIAEPFDLGASSTALHISASIGIALYPDQGSDAAMLLRHADLAMYQAKMGGRNTFRHYEAAMTDHAVRKLSLETDLRHALEGEGLAVHYQPIIDVLGGSLVGAEALVRWHHPERGMVPPSELIPLAEEIGLIREVGVWVLERVCRTLRQWGWIGVQIPISVNLSSHQIQRGLSVDIVQALLQRYDLSPGLLAFEITESVLVSDTLQTSEWLKAIRGLGIRLDLDDFGTGFSSLAYLKRYPIDRIKIDRAFVCDLVANLNDRALVKAVLAMAHSLHLRVVAEGVEDAEQDVLLRQLGCDYAQGFYYARPVPDDAFLEIASRLIPSLARSTAMNGR